MTGCAQTSHLVGHIRLVEPQRQEPVLHIVGGGARHVG